MAGWKWLHVEDHVHMTILGVWWWHGRLTMVICGGSCTYDHIRGVVMAWQAENGYMWRIMYIWPHRGHGEGVAGWQWLLFVRTKTIFVSSRSFCTLIMGSASFGSWRNINVTLRMLLLRILKMQGHSVKWRLITYLVQLPHIQLYITQLANLITFHAT